MAANEERVRKLQGRRARRQSPGKTAETAESGPGDFHRRSDLPGFCSDLATREVALEAGVAVGTLYDYFPSKEALLSGYIRHQLDALLQHMDESVVQANDLDWPTRIKRLIYMTCNPVDDRQPLFNHAVSLIEHQIAEPKHHRRVFEELSRKWGEALAACSDLPVQPSQTTIDAWVIMAWGGRRYCVTAQPAAAQTAAWLSEMETLICGRLASAT